MFIFYQILMDVVKLTLHIGQRLGSKRYTHCSHNTLCPHGIKACVLSSTLHTTHISPSFSKEGRTAGTSANGIFTNSNCRLLASSSTIYIISGSLSSGVIKSSSLYTGVTSSFSRRKNKDK